MRLADHDEFRRLDAARADPPATTPPATASASVADHDPREHWPRGWLPADHLPRGSSPDVLLAEAVLGRAVERGHLDAAMMFCQRFVNEHLADDTLAGARIVRTAPVLSWLLTGRRHPEAAPVALADRIELGAALTVCLTLADGTRQIRMDVPDLDRGAIVALAELPEAVAVEVTGRSPTCPGSAVGVTLTGPS